MSLRVRSLASARLHELGQRRQQPQVVAVVLVVGELWRPDDRAT